MDRSPLCYFMFLAPLLYIILLSCFAVDIRWYGIHTTTKVLPSQRKREMLITCVVFSPLLLFLKNFRFVNDFYMLTKLHHLFYKFLNIYKSFTLCRKSNWQVKKMINCIRQYLVPLQKYIAMMDLQVAIIISLKFWFEALICWYWNGKV